MKLIFFLQSYFLIVCFSYVINDCFNASFIILEGIFQTDFPSILKTSSWFWVVILNIIVYPVLLRRKMLNFKPYYMVSFISGTVIIILISVSYWKDNLSVRQDDHKSFKMFKNEGLYKTFSLMVFACMCHNNVLDVYHETKYKNSSRFKSVRFRIAGEYKYFFFGFIF